MKLINSFKQRLPTLEALGFESLALDIFHFQAQNNQIYMEYLSRLGVDHLRIDSIDKIPFLPIEFFKYHDIKTGEWLEEKAFLSSGTTGMQRSKHLVEDLHFYEQNAKMIFDSFYGDMGNMTFFALLPSYQQQGNSSLIAMVDYFMKESKSERGGYYLDNTGQLIEDLQNELKHSHDVVLFGVGYALLDFCEGCRSPLDGLTIIETGGMKGRREEMTKDEFYTLMKNKLGAVSIHSEYGMTELLSQAYSQENHRFSTPSTMKILIRDINDPFTMLDEGKAGGINVIDLANIHSCSFIETKDLGSVHSDGSFDILGRIDNSDIRGCNLLVV
ncbi:acyl transferase [Reichenbachiella agarivorans]|uniref:Acyl transferase n=1 Tax=Reichenbachiella agarivorans TaxID=2979464 RepID=A0ABY6CK30_9BACT|nr:acyl transferase [Reichenbachiella agarivorans]UXP30866.1 acyl transferase [Reichenbachiella agarivorans]